jgi:Uma2 family endonuclease
MAVKTKEDKKRLLKLLVYEKVNGKPIYYRGYREVLAGRLPPEAVMGSSGIQSYIIVLLLEYLLKALDKSKYILLGHELGFIYKKGSWRNLDIAIFEREKVEPYLTQDRFVPVAPKVAIEVDTKADLSRYGSVEDYSYEKSQDLLDAGVERVIWIFTKPKKVMIAQKGQKWIVQNWDEDFELIEGLRINLAELLSGVK